jgi:hypothetical protein
LNRGLLGFIKNLLISVIYKTLLILFIVIFSLPSTLSADELEDESGWEEDIAPSSELALSPARELLSGWTVGGSLRVRTEYLADSFRLLAPAVDQLYLSRLELQLGYRVDDWRVDLEIQDSRAWSAEPLSPLGTDDVNVLEPITLKVSRHWSINEGSAAELSIGRMTVDYGSRRLLAKNRFRNTSNAFQGVLGTFTSPQGETRLLYSYPLQREPSGLDGTALRDNDFALDKAGRSERFWGVMHDLAKRDDRPSLSVYLFGSERSDRRERPTADRELLTAGLRSMQRVGSYDWEAEAAYQWGSSLAGVLSPSEPELDHRAWFTHLHLGRQLSGQLNLRLSYDQATGDKDPADGSNERFDRLYGARAFELGPSGIFGAAIRSNLRSPALRLLWQPAEGHSWLLSHRWLQLDSARDALLTASRRDLSGASGRDVGRQWELRWRWRPPASSFDLEIGAAYLVKGAYFSGRNPDAPLNPADESDSRYGFLQFSRRF